MPPFRCGWGAYSPLPSVSISSSSSSILSLNLDLTNLSGVKEAFHLFNIMRGTFGTSGDKEWLVARFGIAAKSRWQALLARCNTAVGFDLSSMFEVWNMQRFEKIYLFAPPSDKSFPLFSSQNLMVDVDNENMMHDHIDKASIRGANALGARRKSKGGGSSGGSGGQQRVASLIGQQGADHLYKGLEAISEAILDDVQMDLELQVGGP